MQRTGKREGVRRDSGDDLPDAVEVRLGRAVGRAVRAGLRRWEDSFATSSLAYLLREGAWSQSAWRRVPGARRARIAPNGRIGFHLP